MIGITGMRRGDCRRRLCEGYISTSAIIGVRRGYPIGYGRGVKVKSYMIDED